MPRGAVTGNIFISYRREDSAAYAGRICDHLNARFGADRVFMDVDDVAPGQQFAHSIDQTMATCEVALVIIGPKWIEILQKRLEESSQDYVHHEIESALARNISIIPVLVGGASIAQLTGLPDKLAGLRRYQAAELRDSTFRADCTRLGDSLGLRNGNDPRLVENRNRRRKNSLLVLGGATVLLGLIAALATFTGLGPLSEYGARRSTVQRMAATARAQADRTEYESAFRTYQSLLNVDPGNRDAMDLQADAAMRWLQDFRVIVGEGQKAEDIAGPPLAEIMSVLHEGFARTSRDKPRAADILAHLGWAHWLNQHLAHKEFGPAAERDLRQALSIDPTNVFAHAMLGNRLLQTNGSIEDAQRHFAVALKTGKERPFVRRMQLGGMVFNHDPRVRSDLIKAVNDMRRNGESIDEAYKRRILSQYHPGLNGGEELKITLSAVPLKDAWATFLWLDDKQSEGTDFHDQQMRRDFIQASIEEMEGKRLDALARFTKLELELKLRGYDGRIATHVAAATRRLSR